MKKQFWAVLMCLSLFLTACGSAGENRIDRSREDNPIVFINWYKNQAWGYTSIVRFVDLKGNVYYCDLSEGEPQINSEEELLQELEKIRQESKTETTLTRENVRNCYLQIKDINPTAGYSEKDTAADAGQDSLYVNSATKGMILLDSKGDQTKILQDKTAQKLSEQYEATGLKRFFYF